MRQRLLVISTVVTVVLTATPALAQPTPQELDVVTTGEGIQVTVTMSGMDGATVGGTPDHLDGLVGIYPVRQDEIDWAADFLAVPLYQTSLNEFQATVQIGSGDWAVVIFPTDGASSSSVPAPFLITIEGFFWWPWLLMLVAVAAVFLWLNRDKIGGASAPDIDASISGQLLQQGSTGQSVAGVTVSKGQLG
ncbi:MAG: hypothetical protein OEX97_04980 [Acidimicrobiia bacterium]|nr:hypothetical protein [Acidimicrobiia bacterium]